MPFHARKLTLGALLLLTSLNTSATDVPPLLRFAQQNAGLQPGQITDRAAFERETVVRVKLGNLLFNQFRYDPPSGTALIRLKPSDNNLGLISLAEDCQTTGKVAIKTSDGAPSSYTTRTCERVVLSDHDCKVLGQPQPGSCLDGCPPDSLLLAKATPDDLRRLQEAAHVVVAVTFAPTITNDVPVRRTERTRPPKPGNMVETLTRTYYLSATVRKLEFFLPWATTPFATQSVSK